MLNINNNPLISVILPFYNSEEYLDKAIQSILNQTYSYFEFILLDDGSNDSSLAIANKYSEYDKRVKVYHHANMGLCKTLQKGVNLAEGKYIARMDGDDIADPKRFELQVNYLEQNPNCVLLGTALTVIDPDGDLLYTPEITQEHTQLVKQLLQWEGPRICHPTVMMRTQLVRLVGGYTQEYHFEDIDLFLKLAKYGNLANLAERLLWYRWHIDSITHTRNSARLYEIKQVVHHRAISNLKLSMGIDISALSEREVPSSDRAIDLHYESLCRWSLLARESGFYRTSFKHLVIIFKNKPFAFKTYWAVINFILGQEKGSATWRVFLQIKNRLVEIKKYAKYLN